MWRPFAKTRFDPLGRLSQATNLWGTFTYCYVGVTPRLQTVSSTNGPTTNYSYTSLPNDIRLSQIQNVKGSTPISDDQYAYTTVGTISSWQQQTDSATPTVWNYQYDKADQLQSAVKSNTSTNAVVANDVYGYDLAGNRTSQQVGLTATQATYNSDNQRVSAAPGGPVQFSGTLNKPATVTVAGNMAQVNSNNTFSGSANLTTGTNTVSIVGTDENGGVTTNKYQVVIPPGATKTPTYDLNGNLTNDGAGKTFQWDAKDELVQINYTGGAVNNGITGKSQGVGPHY